jgi:hypothetical protein
MKRGLAAVALLCAALCPERVLAKAVEDVRFSADADDVVVTVLADQALHAPTVRTYPGMVRVRFYDADQWPFLTVAGDGGAVRSLELGPGSDQTAALTLFLGDKTRLGASDVRVEHTGGVTVLKIARGLLPAVGVARPPQPLAHKAKPVAPPVRSVAPARAPELAPAAPVHVEVAAPIASGSSCATRADEASEMPFLLPLIALAKRTSNPVAAIHQNEATQ